MTSSNLSTEAAFSSVDNNQSVEEIIDLRRYFTILKKYIFRVSFLAILVALLTAIIALNITPTYRSTATLLIESQQNKAVSFAEVYGLDSNRKEYYLTQFEILKSRKIAQTVIEKLNLKEHADFIEKPSAVRDFIKGIKESLPFIPNNKLVTLSLEEQEKEALQDLVIAFTKRLTISPVRKTQLVHISFESSDSALAALVANTVGEVYIEQHLIGKTGVTKAASGWLTTRLTDLRVKLDESELRLQQYLESENLIDISGVLGLVSKELEQTSVQLVVERNEKNKLESIIRVIDEYGRDNLEVLQSIPDITSHKAIQDIKKTLVTSELKLSDLSGVYGPKHPKLIAAKAELASVQKNLSLQVQRLVKGVQKELNTSKRNVKALEVELVRIKKAYREITAKEYEYRKLSREVETNRNIYDTFFSRAKETEVTSDFNAAVARFTDRAYKGTKPIKPNKPLLVILTFVATFGLGVVIAFVLDALNDTFKTASDIENKLSQRMLGLLPQVALKKNAEFMVHYFFDDDAHKFAESVRTLRTSFVLTQLDKSSKVVEVTSTVPGEGKSTTAINLAFSLAQVEKTILIDADMRKPSICKRFNIPLYHPGLSNLITGTEQIADCIYQDEKSGLTIMPCGQIPSNPLELLLSPKFEVILTHLKKSYDRIIIDTPPVQAVSDSLVIAQQSDAVIYVVKSDDTRIGAAQEGIGRLVNVNANIAGVVLNKVDTKKMASDEYYHGYYSDSVYGQREES
ncbi:MAG: polysaccharide biosynthesis tyrosine autokinase [Alteromonadales bacterium]|nr:polysaccharide biosynthesis tyrosine autokinase [Alteromonadales bacterium]